MPSRVYDLALFRELNEEYRDTPLVPRPPGRTTSSYERVARKRIGTVSQYVDVAGKRVLELGTGRGYTAAALPKVSGATHVTGVDIRRYDDWDQHDAASTRFVVGDLASEKLVEDGSIDVVISAVVFEHVTQPIRMLRALYDTLSDDGTAWLYFNLYRGPKASHRYRQIYFPWPHLLFEDVVAEQALAEAGVANATFAWVNRMTAADYVQACAEIGLEVTEHRRHAVKLADHLDFLTRFDDKLGRYPALDLETDFLTLVLRKRAESVTSVPLLGYAARQAQLDRLMDRHRRQAVRETRLAVGEARLIEANGGAR